MKTPRSRFNVARSHLTWLLVGIACWPATWAEESDWRILHPNLSQEFTRYAIPLTYEADSGQLFCFSLNQDSHRLGEDDGAENYTDRIVFDLTPLGQRYTVLLRPAKSFNLIDKENWQLLEVRFTQENGDQSTVLREGLWILGNRIEIPVTLCAQQLALVNKNVIDSTLTCPGICDA